MNKKSILCLSIIVILSFSLYLAIVFLLGQIDIDIESSIARAGDWPNAFYIECSCEESDIYCDPGWCAVLEGRTLNLSYEKADSVSFDWSDIDIEYTEWFIKNEAGEFETVKECNGYCAYSFDTSDEDIFIEEDHFSRQYEFAATIEWEYPSASKEYTTEIGGYVSVVKKSYFEYKEYGLEVDFLCSLDNIDWSVPCEDLFPNPRERANIYIKNNTYLPEGSEGYSDYWVDMLLYRNGHLLDQKGRDIFSYNDDVVKYDLQALYPNTEIKLKIIFGKPGTEKEESFKTVTIESQGVDGSVSSSGNDGITWKEISPK